MGRQTLETLSNWYAKDTFVYGNCSLGNFFGDNFGACTNVSCIITLIKRRKNPLIFFKRIELFLFLKPWVSSHKDALCQVWLKLATWDWRSNFFFYFCNVFSLFHNYLPLWKRTGPFIWTNLNSLHPINTLWKWLNPQPL